ncbi:MAG: hypothetical protein K2X48_02680 [Chitinophagaceae bacterium]|nr:hypothetical protein [Chitinophagaceae bacterium]
MIHKYTFLFLLAFCFYVTGLYAQSPDARVCNCFTKAISADFMLGTKAGYGRIALFLSRDMELKPNQSQPVKFTFPALEAKQGCTASYTLYIADERGAKIYEATGRNNEFTHSFNDCSKTYEVRLVATAKSVNGGDGNCSRSINIKVKSVCNTVVCECFNQKDSKAISGDININGSMNCLPVQNNQRRYILGFGISNKSNCVLNVESITVHGQTIAVPAYNTAPRSETKGISLGFSTPMSQGAPADSKVTVVVRYSLNGRKCSVTMDLPYNNCN